MNLSLSLKNPRNQAKKSNLGTECNVKDRRDSSKATDNRTTVGRPVTLLTAIQLQKIGKPVLTGKLIQGGY